jgi:uncharacterized membrane protein YbhN (UPF0104 family)
VNLVTAPDPRVGSTTAPGTPAVPGLDPAPGTRRRRHLRWRVVLGLSAVPLLGAELVLVAPTLGGALTALRGAQPWWIAVAVLAEATSMDLFARMRRRLLSAAGVRVGMRDALAGPAVVTWSLVAGGLISTSALAALAVAGSLLVGARSGVPALALDAVLAVVLVTGVRLLRRHPRRQLEVGRRLLLRVNVMLRRPPNRGVGALERLVGQLRLVRPGARDATAAAAYAVGNWTFDIACLAAGVAALGVRGVTLPLLLASYTAGMAASSTSLLPGGIGVVDTTMVVVMVAGGVPAAAALPVVLLYRLISLVAVVAAGWLVAAARSRRTGWSAVSCRAGRGRP